MGWLCPVSKQYDSDNKWIWGKLKFAPARFNTRAALSNVPTQMDTISTASVVYAAPPHGRTRYNLASAEEALLGTGQAGVFLTYIEFLVQQARKAQAGEATEELSALRVDLPPREIDVQTDDDEFSEEPELEEGQELEDGQEGTEGQEELEQD